MPRRLEKIVSKEEFIHLLKENKKIKDFFKIGNFLDGKMNRNLYYNLEQKAEELEEFIDNHTNVAKTKKFQYPRELIAGTKWFSKAAFELDYILDRMDDYGVDKKGFIRNAKDNLALYNTKLCLIFNATKTFFSNLGIDNGGKAKDEERLESRVRYVVKDEEREEEFVENEEAYIEKIILDYFNADEMLKKLIEKGVKNISESEAKELNIKFNEIKTEYDSCVSNTKDEALKPELMKIRSHAAICEHLLKISQYMIHFYERHEDVIRHSEAKEKIAQIISPLELLSIVKDFSLFYAGKYSGEGGKIGEEIIAKEGIIEAVVKCEPFYKGIHAEKIYDIMNKHKLKIYVGNSSASNEAFNEVRINSPVNIMCGLYAEMIKHGKGKSLDDKEARIRISGDDSVGLVKIRRYLRELQK